MQKLIYFTCFLCIASFSFTSCEKEDIGFPSNWGADPEPEIQPTAEFIYHLNASFNVSFQSNSKNAKSFSWNFGDGTTSPSENPEHTYMSIGKKLVTLTVYNGKKSSMAYAEIDMTGYITLRNESSYSFSVKIDNESYKSLSGKSSRTYSVKPGSHTVYVEQISGYILWPTKRTYYPTCYPGDNTSCIYSFNTTID